MLLTVFHMAIQRIRVLVSLMKFDKLSLRLGSIYKAEALFDEFLAYKKSRETGKRQYNQCLSGYRRMRARNIE